MAKTDTSSTAHKIEEFAEDLGKMLGSARAKAEGWLGQRQDIVEQLTQLRDEATKLLSDLGHEAQSVVAVGRKAYGKRRGRPAGSKNKKPGIIFVGGRTGQTISTAATTVVNKIRGMAMEPIRKRRKMSAAARAKISAAQKKRWAKQRAAGKK